MSAPKKITLPDIAREELTQQEHELLEFVEVVVEMANRLQEDVSSILN
jgi:hypothetical protein